MQRKYALFHFLIILALLVGTNLDVAYAGPDDDPYNTFLNAIGGAGWDEGNSMAPTSDGGYIVAGSTSSFGEGSNDILLLKYTSSGALEWAKTAGSKGNDQGKAVAQTADGGYIVAGTSTSYGYGDQNVLILKFDSAGEVEWARAVGEQSVEEGADALALTSDGGYIVAGYTDDDVYVLKFAGNGNWEWARTVNGGSGIDYAVSVQQTADGGYIVAGSTYSFSADDSDIMLLKFEEDAGVMSLAWTRIIQYEGDTEEDAYAVIQNSDNDYVIAGSLGITSTLLLEVTEGGAIPWAVSAYGDGIKGFSSVAQTSDGGYIAAGNPSSSGIGDFDALLFKYSDTGTLSWAKTIGGDQKDIARAVAQSSDGGYAIAGSTSSFGSGIFSVLLAKTDPNGDILDCEVCTTVSPTTSSLTLSLTSPTLTPGAPTPTITTPVVSSVSIALEMDFVCGLHEKLYLPVVLNE